MEGLLKDLKFGLRMLWKSPGLTLAAVASLALGIGANTAIFTVINGVFFPPLAVERPEELVSLYTADEKNPGFLAMSYPNFEDYRDSIGGFDGLVAYQFAPMSYRTEDGEGEAILGALVSGDYFSVLGVDIANGRGFLPEENTAPGAHPVAVVSHGFWQRRTGADPSLVGQTIFVNRVPLTVVGITPSDFSGIDVGAEIEVFAPMMMFERLSIQPTWIENRRALINSVVGRLAPDVTVAQVQEATDALAKRLAAEYPDDNEGRSLSVVPTLEARVNPNARAGLVQALALMTVVVGLVLLIACANVANLLLSRATARRREVAVRLALGARRRRLVRQLLTESVLLALFGGVAGLLVAEWTVGLLVAAIPTTPIPVAFSFGIDTSVLLVTLAVAILTGVVFGLAPSAQAARADVIGALRNDSAAAAGGDRRLGLRNLLVVAQVAVSLALLVGAGMFVRSMRSAQAIDPGFDVENGLVIAMNLDLEGYDTDEGRAFIRELTARSAALPGASSATVASMLPLSLFGGLQRTVFPDGAAAAEVDEGTLVTVNSVGADYFETLGIDIISGRGVQASDTGDSLRAAVVNAVMAETFWPGESAIGQRFAFHGQLDEPLTVVGISEYVKVGTLGEVPAPMAYMPIEQEYTGTVFLHVRTEVAPETLSEPLRREILSLDAEMPLFGITTLTEQVDASLFFTRVGVALLGVFGAVGLALAAIGLYGVMAYTVAQRTREIGIRMALGARSGSVLKLVLRRGLALVGTGLAIGLVLAFLLARQMTALLYGVGATDLVAFGTTSLVLLAVAALASVLPAHRATRVDPVRALKAD